MDRRHGPPLQSLIYDKATSVTQKGDSIVAVASSTRMG
jgi:hypothetical protein